MHTEEEAKTKWCSKPTEEKCCATACMAWRWSGEAVYSRSAEKWLRPKSDDTNLPLPARGYCGLAGKP